MTGLRELLAAATPRPWADRGRSADSPHWRLIASGTLCMVGVTRVAEIILIGRERDAVDDVAGQLVDEFIFALQPFTTKELLAVADRRDKICPGGWMQRVIREYVEVWR